MPSVETISYETVVFVFKHNYDKKDQEKGSPRPFVSKVDIFREGYIEPP